MHSKISHLKLFPDPSRDLSEVLEPSPTPWGTPTSARPGSDFKVYFMKDIFLGIVKLVILNFFVTPPDIWVSFWSHPQPHGELQNQPGQELILEPILIEKHYCLFPPRPFWPLSRLSPIQTLQFFMVIDLVCIVFYLDPGSRVTGHPHGGPQHQQGQGLILENAS